MIKKGGSADMGSVQSSAVRKKKIETLNKKKFCVL
jgi:hypothetical protein